MSIALEMLYDNNREIAVFDTLDHFCRFINNLVISKMIDNENYIQNCILNFEKILRIGKTIIKIG